MSIPNPLDSSLWLIAKMCVRLLLTVIAAKAAGGTIPVQSMKGQSALFRVECGRYALAFTTSDLDQSPSRSPARRSRTGEAASTSTGTTAEATARPLLVASSSTEPFGNGSLGQAFEP